MKHRGVVLALYYTVPFTPLATICDPEGHYLILLGLLQDVETTVISYYAPNANLNPFFFHLLQVVKDRPPYTSDSHFPSPSPSVTFAQMLQPVALDTWRTCNLLRRNNIFYSHPHNFF